MICQNCGLEAPTKYVAFYQNVGALIMRFSKSIEGNLCKSCIHKSFWPFTATTLFLGWWGLISFVVTPFFLLNNIFRYLLSLPMDPVPVGASQPELTDEVISKLQPHTDDLIERLNAGDDFERVVANTAMKAHVSKGQVALYIQALVAASRAPEDDLSD